MSDAITTLRPAGATPATDRPDEKIRSIAKTRVQLDFSPRAMSLLSELKEKTEAASYAEVIRNALKLYDGLITEAESGATFMVRGANGEISPFKMFL
jgi:hypothetical protein